jgi:hypothetical protein
VYVVPDASAPTLYAEVALCRGEAYGLGSGLGTAVGDSGPIDVPLPWRYRVSVDAYELITSVKFPSGTAVAPLMGYNIWGLTGSSPL